MTTSQVADAGTALMGFLGGFCAVIFLLIFFYVVFEFVNLLICVGGTVKTFVSWGSSRRRQTPSTRH